MSGRNVFGRVLCGAVVAVMAISLSVPAAVRTGKSQFWANLETKKAQKLVIHGSSLSFQQPGVSENVKWPLEMKSQIDKAIGSGVMTFKNISVRGTYSKEGLATVANAIKEAPNAVILEFASNDAVCRFACDVACARANWEGMLKAIQKDLPNCEIFIYVTALPWDYQKPDNTQCALISGSNKANLSKRKDRPNVEAYFKMLRELAAQYNTYLVDTYGKFASIWDTKGSGTYVNYLYDGHHTTLKAAQEIIVPDMLAAFKGTGSTAATTVAAVKAGATRMNRNVVCINETNRSIRLGAGSTGVELFTLEGKRVVELSGRDGLVSVPTNLSGMFLYRNKN